jgi:hypothetical protein
MPFFQANSINSGKPMKPNSMAALALVITCAFTSESNAASIVNGDFELFGGLFGADGGAQLGAGTSLLPGWTVVGSQVGLLKAGNSYHLTASSGNQFLDLTGYESPGQGAGQGVQQLLSDLQVGSHYRITFDIGLSNGLCVSSAVNCHGPVGVSASAGATVASFVHASSLPGNVWSTYSFDFTAGASAVPLKLVMNATPGLYVGLDNVSLSQISTVPEPDAMALLVGGLCALAVARPKRQSPIQTASSTPSLEA